jgi:type II secretory pathway component PulF
MAHFNYKYKTGPGKAQSGTVFAESFDKAVEKIIASGQTPLEVKPVSPVVPVPAASECQERLQPRGGKVPAEILSVFIRQLGDLLEAQVPVLRALDLLGRQVRYPVLQKIVERLRADVEDGGSLSGAFRQFPLVFSAFHVQMVKCGESSGHLPAVVLHLADLMEGNIDLQRRIRMGLTYPLIILAVGISTIFVMLTFVLPRLTVMFDDFNAVLPWPTLVVIAVSRFFSAYWWLIIVVCGVAGHYGYRWYQTAEGRSRMQSLLLRLPLLKIFLYRVETVRFTRGFGTLLSNGVPVVEAMESSAALIDNDLIRQEINGAVVKVRSGTSVSNALKGTVLFGDIEVSLVAVAEESGRFDQGLNKLTAMCERNVRQTAEMFVTIIGPAALIVIVGVVGFIVVAILLPMLQMNSIIS